MKLNIIGKLNEFGNLYALSEDGTVYVGRRKPEHWERGLSECQIRSDDYDWQRYPKSKTPRAIFELKPQKVIDIGL